MEYHLIFKTYTEDGQLIELDTRIIWLPNGGDWPGGHPVVIWQDDQGHTHKQSALYYGRFRNQEGVVVYQGLEKIVLTIPRVDYENHIKAVMDIFNRHTTRFSQEFKTCGLKNCPVCMAATVGS